MVYIVHGSSSLVKDQIKTEAEHVLSAAYHQHDEQQFLKTSLQWRTQDLARDGSTVVGLKVIPPGDGDKRGLGA